MTTIAYMDNVLAGDTLITDDGGTILWKEPKVFLLANSGLWGAAGSKDEHSDKLIRERVGKTAPDQAPLAQGSATYICNETWEIEAIYVSPNGDIYLIDVKNGNTEVNNVHSTYIAIGTGSAYAYGALGVGASARQAVRIACNRDVYSGGEVTSVALFERKS